MPSGKIRPSQYDPVRELELTEQRLDQVLRDKRRLKWFGLVILAVGWACQIIASNWFGEDGVSGDWFGAYTVWPGVLMAGLWGGLGNAFYARHMVADYGPRTWLGASVCVGLLSAISIWVPLNWLSRLLLTVFPGTGNADEVIQAGRGYLEAIGITLVVAYAVVGYGCVSWALARRKREATVRLQLLRSVDSQA